MYLSVAQHQLHPNSPHQEPQSLDNMIANSMSPADKHQQPDQKKPRPPENEPQACPRCESTITKFCYYNNYSLAQPRYFCKTCRRYWTKGGTLRDVPVGGGCRKSSKRPSSTSNSPSHYFKRAHTQDNTMTSASAPNPVFAGINNLQHAYGGGVGGLGFEALMGNVNFLGYPGMSFSQEIQYGNGGGGLMYQGNLCNYDENGAGNSNCVSGVSDDVAAIVPYDDGIAVKQERGENDAFWGLPWQSIKSEFEPVRENWNGIIDNSAWSLLNTPALM